MFKEKISVTNLEQIPLGTLKLKFDEFYNKPIGNNLLRLKCINDIIFGFKYNQPVDNFLPLIITLTFGHNYNQSVNQLPESIKYLKFDYSFNQFVDNLPNSISKLIFGKTFNKPVDNLPNSIRYLQFGELYFDNFIENIKKSKNNGVIEVIGPIEPIGKPSISMIGISDKYEFIIGEAIII